MSDILERIVAVKREEVAAGRARRSLASWRAEAESAERRAELRDFAGALRAKVAAGQSAVIAEVKKASPSKGVLREHFVPAEIAASYARHGAACLSVLTDERFFHGHADFLRQARAACGLPVLRKDFIVDEYQVFESRVIGADAILLIVAALSDAQLRAYLAAAADLSLAVLVECHTKEEIDRALDAGAVIIGVNNRDLTTFVTDISVSLKLKRFIPNDRIAVSESGIRNFHTVEQLAQAGFDAVLVGEHLMAQTDRTKALKELLGGRR